MPILSTGFFCIDVQMIGNPDLMIRNVIAVGCLGAEYFVLRGAFSEVRKYPYFIDPQIFQKVKTYRNYFTIYHK